MRQTGSVEKAGGREMGTSVRAIPVTILAKSSLQFLSNSSFFSRCHCYQWQTQYRPSLMALFLSLFCFKILQSSLNAQTCTRNKDDISKIWKIWFTVTIPHYFLTAVPSWWENTWARGVPVAGVGYTTSASVNPSPTGFCADSHCHRVDSRDSFNTLRLISIQCSSFLCPTVDLSDLW